MNIGFPMMTINAIYNFDEQNGVAVGDGGVAYYTVNHWYQHTNVAMQTEDDLFGVWGDGNGKVWAVGDSGVIYYTNNYLLGLNMLSQATTNCLNNVYIYNSNLGLIVGDNGTILKMSNPNSVPGIQQHLVLQIMPNPVSANATIQYSIDKNSYIDLRLINLLGKTVKVLVNQNKIMGNFQTNFSTEGLQNGIYYLKLSTGTRSVVKPVVIFSQ